MMPSGAEDRDLARLRWRCRRGMRELDVLLTRYLERSYAASSPAERAAFAQLLELPDPDLFGYLVGRTTPDEVIHVEIIARIRREQV
jgi:antitoxin CptB